ncbi:MAG: hypothetical protein L0Y74_05280, partial [candidate division Zixibacteria bacterium]|nr:hypothetical protein [candidate division Zixibacteria bacterium]
VDGSFKFRKILAGLEYSLEYEKPVKGDPVSMAYEFLELNKEKLGMKNPREELVHQGTLPGGSGVRRLSFGQTYNGLGIREAGIRVFFTSEGEIQEIDGRYYYDINLPSIYSVDSMSAVQIALNDVKLTPNPITICPSKPIIVSSSTLPLQEENRLYIVWPIQIRPEHTSRFVYIYYIDALNGNIIIKGRDSSLRSPWPKDFPPVPVPGPK